MHHGASENNYAVCSSTSDGRICKYKWRSLYQSAFDRALWPGLSADPAAVARINEVLRKVASFRTNLWEMNDKGCH
eukprot:4538970-Amphidinium_carterae.1